MRVSTGAPAPKTSAVGPTTRRVFIVVRGDVGLFDYIKGRWSGHEGVEVIIDRRRYEQRRRGGPRAPDRRRAERRRRLPADVALRSIGWAEVLLAEAQSESGRPQK